VPGRDRNAPELRAVAPLITLGSSPQLVGAVTLVANGARVIGVTSAELLRPLHGTPLGIATKLDGSATVEVATWSMGRYSGIALVELGGAVPEGDEVVPLAIGSVNASVNVHGAPAAIVTVTQTAGRYERAFIAVHLDVDDAGGMNDHAVHLASPLEPTELPVEGASVFAWLPPDPVLGRPSEVVVFALAYPYRANLSKPRETAVIAELVGLDDLGRALISEPPPDERPELFEVAGEIEEKGLPDPLAGLDE